MTLAPEPLRKELKKLVAMLAKFYPAEFSFLIWTKMDRQNSKIELSPAALSLSFIKVEKPPLKMSLEIIAGSSKYVFLGFTISRKSSAQKVRNRPVCRIAL